MFGLTSLIVAGVLAANPEEPAAANLKPAPTIASEYESRKAQTSRDADAQIKLALWCEQHGLEQERLKHLGAVVLRDPTNALARGLLGLVEYKGTWKRPEAVADAIRTDVAHADLLVEYNARRVKTPVAAGPQYKLGLWCEEKGLTDEARAHFATALRLEPTNVDALKKLGYKKVGNRWTTDAQAEREKAEKEVQSEADKKWKAQLEQLRAHLKDRNKRTQAENALAQISDPRAVPSIMRVFATSSEPDQRISVQLLGQIDAIDSSRNLAKIALLSNSPEIRRRATETLKRRDAREWVDLAIRLLQSKIVYKIKAIGGPNDPGVLDIQTPSVKYKRIYRPGVAYQPQPGDRVGTDATGQLIVSRMGEVQESGWVRPDGLLAGMAAYDVGLSNVNPWTNPQDASFIGQSTIAALYGAIRSGQNSSVVVGDLNRALQNTPFFGQGQGLATAYLTNARVAQQLPFEMAYRANTPTVAGLVNQSFASPAVRGAGGQIDFTYSRTQNLSVAQLQREALNSQAAAADQLNGDKSILDRMNEAITRANAPLLALLTAATGQSFGDDRIAWEKWCARVTGYSITTATDLPTVVEDVPVNYTPQLVVTSGAQVFGVLSNYHSCFGKGTMVQTSSGPKPIEELKLGDIVLSQHLASGKLRYRPVIAVHHNPPAPTYKVELDGQPIISSHIHRFWKAGFGWVMARDLKQGDTIRVIGGVAKVTAIEDAQVQHVFNLTVADDANFFVGTASALVHDVTLPDLKLLPFDAVAAQTK